MYTAVNPEATGSISCYIIHGTTVSEATVLLLPGKFLRYEHMASHDMMFLSVSYTERQTVHKRNGGGGLGPLTLHLIKPIFVLNKGTWS
jgi:hypothetical protein